jgi:hypothetical protein
VLTGPRVDEMLSPLVGPRRCNRTVNVRHARLVVQREGIGHADPKACVLLGDSGRGVATADTNIVLPETTSKDSQTLSPACHARSPRANQPACVGTTRAIFETMDAMRLFEHPPRRSEFIRVSDCWRGHNEAVNLMRTGFPGDWYAPCFV